MDKKRTVFSCQQCGSQHPRWLGRCPECGEWDSLVEETYGPIASSPVSPSTEVYGEWILCGLLILVLASIWKQAVRIAEEQSLTV